MVGVKNWINFWLFNIILYRLDGDDDDVELLDVLVGSLIDDVI